MATTIDSILNKIAELEARLQEANGVNSDEILNELRYLKEMLKDSYSASLGESFSAKTIGPAIATGVEILTPSRVVELVHDTGDNTDLIMSQYGVTKTLENYATKDYVESNGGKIDAISIDGKIQEIDNKKTVNIVLENYATKDFVATNGGKIDTVSIGGETLPIDDNKNVEIPITDEPEGLDTYETEGIDIDDIVSENSSNLITSGAVYNAINELKNSGGASGGADLLWSGALNLDQSNGTILTLNKPITDYTNIILTIGKYSSLDKFSYIYTLGTDNNFYCNTPYYLYDSKEYGYINIYLLYKSDTELTFRYVTKKAYNLDDSSTKVSSINRLYRIYGIK